MNQTFDSPAQAQQVAKRMFWLAWKACGEPLGMGVLQDHPSASEEEVWKNVIAAGDYPGDRGSTITTPYGDYVFGRMLKLSIRINSSSIIVPDLHAQPGYNAWATKYPTHLSLLEAAEKEICHGQQEVPNPKPPTPTPQGQGSR